VRGRLAVALAAAPLLPGAARAEPASFSWTVTRSEPVPAAVRLDPGKTLMLGAVAPQRVVATPADVADAGGRTVLSAGALLMAGSDPHVLCEPERRKGAAAFVCLADADKDGALDQACEIAVDTSEAVPVTFLMGDVEPACGRRLAAPLPRAALRAAEPTPVFVALKLMAKPTDEEDAAAALCLTRTRPAPGQPCDDLVHYIPVGHFGYEVFLYVSGATFEFHAAPATGVTVKPGALRVGQPFPDVGSPY
jgi:hypothetical protein